jgi:hypothetical protein
MNKQEYAQMMEAKITEYESRIRELVDQLEVYR